MTTIARVAQEAGVGVGTVSRVINGSGSVSDATRRRVLEVVAELDYEPNAAARALSTGRTRSVGVIAPFFTRPSVIERLRGVAPALGAEGYQLILFAVETPEHRDAAFRSLIGRVDGLLSISLAPKPGDLERLAAADVPVVLVDHAHDRLPTVTVDDVEGGRMATNHLLGLGHERIAFAGDTEDVVHGFAASSRRCAGYRRALAAAGLHIRPELVRLRPHGRDGGRVIARELLALREPPTAVFAASDLQALSIIEAAEALGARIPQDLSVVGFDDVEVARYAGLTTVAQPLEASGARGAELLLSVLAGESRTPRQHLPLKLVVRSTTSSPGTGDDLSEQGAREGARNASRMT